MPVQKPAPPDRRPAAAGAPPAATAELGVGLRFSLHPHCDGFVDVILGALAAADAAGQAEGLVRETDDVSTYVGAPEPPAEDRPAAYSTAATVFAPRS